MPDPQYTIIKGIGACPWCGRHQSDDQTFPLPMIFKCSECGGMWVLTTPPRYKKPIPENPAQ